MSGSVDILAVGAHPDDAELGCGATLSKAAAEGLRTGIVHLTRGELGTRGTPSQRTQEAERAAEILSVSDLRILDCGDGGLRTGHEEEDSLIAVLRELRPRVVLAPPPKDRHPDHRRAHQLVRDCCYYAGLAKRATSAALPHRPKVVLHYELHDLIEPTFVVDVSSFWSDKLKALQAHASQFWSQKPNPDAAAEAATKIASRAFWESIEGRARVRGLQIGVDLGEGFYSRDPLPIEVGSLL